jgi:hypothetical protein
MYMLACAVLQIRSKGVMPMEWTKPEFVEVSMDSEIGRYQQDDDGRP